MKSTNKFWIFIILVIFSVACTTQGRLTYLTFDDTDDYQELHRSMEELKAEGYDGWKDEQFSAMKELRWISKYMDEPGKQEMAVRAMVFVAFTTDDWDVEDRLHSRIQDIIDSDSWSPALKLAVINALKDLVSGKLGYEIEEEDPEGNDIFLNIPLEIDEREDALDLWISNFDDVSAFLQYKSVEGFREILLTPPTPENCPLDICDEEDRQDPEEWESDLKLEWSEDFQEIKEDLWDELEDLLEENLLFADIPMNVKTNMAQLAGEIRNFHLLPDMEQKFQEVATGWEENESIPANLRQVIASAREKANLYGSPASKQPTISESSYSDFLMQPNEFLVLHLDAILYEQRLRQRLERGEQESEEDSGVPVDLAAQDIPKLDPTEWLFATFDDTPESQEKKDIIYRHVTEALRQGLLLENQDLLSKTIGAINAAENDIARQQILNLVGALYPSLKALEIDPQPILDTLATAAEQTENLMNRRMYLHAMADGAETFPGVISGKIATMSITMDVLTRHQIDTKIQILEKFDTPDALPEEAPVEADDIPVDSSLEEPEVPQEDLSSPDDTILEEPEPEASE